jgi:uncharacterized protein YjbJ (UPF0337 family)
MPTSSKANGINFKGELKKQWGNFTNDDLTKIEGSYEKFQGVVQERYGDKKDEVARWTDDWYERSRLRQIDDAP